MRILDIWANPMITPKYILKVGWKLLSESFLDVKYDVLSSLLVESTALYFKMIEDLTIYMSRSLASVVIIFSQVHFIAKYFSEMRNTMSLMLWKSDLK